MLSISLVHTIKSANQWVAEYTCDVKPFADSKNTG